MFFRATSTYKFVLSLLTAVLPLSAQGPIIINPGSGSVVVQPGAPHNPGGPTLPPATWKCGIARYVAPNGSDITGTGTMTLPWRSLTHALGQVQNQLTQGTPVVIHLASGTYDISSGEGFPIRIPSRGLKLQGEGATRPVLVGDAVNMMGPTDQVLFVDDPGTDTGPCGPNLPTEIRDLEILHGFTGIEIHPGGTGALPLAGPERVEIVNCVIRNNIDTGILIRNMSGWRSRHLIEGNEIHGNFVKDEDGNALGIGLRILNAGESSTHVRANQLHNQEINLELSSTTRDAGSCQPRIQSNFFFNAEQHVVLGGSSPWIVSNTIADAVPFSDSGVSVVYGINYFTSLADTITVANNILWNGVPQAGVLAVDLSLQGGTQIVASNDIEDVNDPNIGINGNVRIPPQFVQGGYHLRNVSPLHELGDNTYVAAPPVLTLPTFAARVDLGMDVDGDSRITDHDANGVAVVAIGADEFSQATVTTVATPAIDAFGNISRGGAMVQVTVTVNTRVGDDVMVYLWAPGGSLDPDIYNVFQDPLGNLRLPIGRPTVMLVGSGTAVGGAFTTNFSISGAAGLEECELYLQARSEFPLVQQGNPQLGYYTNRVRYEINP